MLTTFRGSRQLLQASLTGRTLLQPSKRSSHQHIINSLLGKYAPSRGFRSSLSRPQPRQLQTSAWRTAPVRHRGLRHNSTNTKPTPQEQGSEKKSLSLKERFQDLSRKYGWAAVGVYFGLSALDFPFCYLAVRFLGTERIAQAEHFVVEGFWNIVGLVMPNARQNVSSITPEGPSEEAEHTAREGGVKPSHHDASLWTQLLLAYGVHKSLIFFRVPLTAAVTPRIVKWLRARGWNIGRPKA